ncbi:Rv2993c-like domain-containing protein [Mycobacterium pseudokansasii]|uniref:Rv2993c-like domain-containing protein n=1 Tax=Mycobacterium pseudokansasii TaxID=2341080 RepID=UPI0009BFFE85
MLAHEAHPNARRFASPDGPSGRSAFVASKARRTTPGDDRPGTAEHLFGTPNFTGRSWPLADVRLPGKVAGAHVLPGC